MTTAGAEAARDRALFPDVAGRRELVGGWASLTLIHYFVVEAIALSAWRGTPDYDRRAHVISDLGAAHCGPFNGYVVCSPLNWLMNGSFVLQSLAMVLGALMLSTAVLSVAAQPGSRAVRPTKAALLSKGSLLPRNASLSGVPWLAAGAVRLLILIAGVGQGIVGVVPEDTNLTLHLTGAGMYFIAGPLSLLVLGVVWVKYTAMGWMVILFGVVSLSATAYVLAAGLRVAEPGAIERTMAYPIILGLSLVGLIVAQRVHRQRKLVRTAARSAGQAAQQRHPQAGSTGTAPTPQP